ncbi:MAG TPA: sugar phosphate isomerase/epimerase family protein [Chloroflexota bacterium]|nr:sugar phosphate isomerase/epimerase family protein [Chloroflexota bacterium]
MKIGLYSITYMGIWYRGRALAIPELIDRAAEIGFDGIELDGKRPHANPMDWGDRERAAFRDRCGERGLEVIGVASNNDFSSPVPEYRECQLLMVREQIRLCRDVGGRIVRLFFAWPGVTLDAEGLAGYELARAMWADTSRYSTRRQQWDHVRDCLREAARVAEDTGVTLALQNHAPLLRHYRDMLDMVREVDSPALRACLDVPILENQEDAYVRRAVLETGELQVLSHFGGEFARQPDGSVRPYEYDFGRGVANYPVFVRALKEVGYDGYLSYEFCHPAMDARHEMQGLERVDEQTRLAFHYLRDLLVAEQAYSGRAAPTAASR